MYPILKKEKLSDKIFLMVVKAPRVADGCSLLQFAIMIELRALLL